MALAFARNRTAQTGVSLEALDAIMSGFSLTQPFRELVQCVQGGRLQSFVSRRWQMKRA
jgi:hypothetical protein